MTSGYGPAMEPYEVALIGVVLLAYTVVSQRSAAWPLTMPMVFVAVGAAMSATGIVEVSAELGAIGLLAEVTLAVILFSDASRLSLPRLRRQFAIPARLLGIGLPLTILSGAVVYALLFESTSIAEHVLLAAILAPTDAALGSAVIEDESVPARERLALTVESGLNDGLVVPVATIATSVLLDEHRSTASWVWFGVQQIGLGTLIGLVIGTGGVVLLRRAKHAGWSDGRYEQIATFALPVLALCAAEAIDANGFIGAFVAGLAFGTGGDRWTRRRGRPITDADPMAEAEALTEFTEDSAQLLGVIAFFVFGNLFVGESLGDLGPKVVVAALASLTIVRMIPVVVALIGTGWSWPSKLFVGWFGPRGLASIAFGILLLEEFGETNSAARELFGAITLTVTFSVVLHGATAAFGASRYGKYCRLQTRSAEDHDLMLAEERSAHEAMPRPRWTGRPTD